MRIVVLWTRLSGYLNACLKELASRDGVELLVLHQAAGEDAPYDDDQFEWIEQRLEWRTLRELESQCASVQTFGPEILVVPSWHVAPYRGLARRLAGRCWRVMTMDHPWRGTLRQRVGTWISPYFLHPIADAVWLPGERQAEFARRLGFRQGEILRGLYACDQSAFEVSHLDRIAGDRPVPRSFLFAGRFSPEKGVETLAQAYQLYRNSNANPWPLICCGTGPLRSKLENKPGIRIEGFVQPQRIPEVFASAGCLILPSLFEPWALVVHEAASAGMLVLASEEVGATPHLVQPGYNGFVCGKRDAAGLAALMSRVSAMSDAGLDEMSRNSFLLSRQYSPKRWADTLLSSFSAFPRSWKVQESSIAAL